MKRESRIKEVMEQVFGKEETMRREIADIVSVQEKEGKDPIIRLAWKSGENTLISFCSDFDLQSMLNHVAIYMRIQPSKLKH